jgi:hypothetical protein
MTAPVMTTPLEEFIWKALVHREPFVEVPVELLPHVRWAAELTRSPWIPGINEHVSCGAVERVESRHAERWCLLGVDHDGPHGFAAA